jgi:ribosomal protein L9
MTTFTEIVSNVNSFSDEELKQIELAIKKEKAQRQIEEILEAAKIAKQESEEGKTFIASTPEEIIEWFKDAMKNAD